MLNDLVTLVKTDGTVAKENIKAMVQPTKIFMNDATLPIEPGDRLLRSLPSGLVEEYIVDDPGFFAGMRDIEAHFQTAVRRSGSPAAQPSAIINNIQGQNARININSTDYSRNVAVSNDTAALFQSLRDTLAQSNIPNEDRQAIRAAIEKMEQSYPTDMFKSAYVDFMSIAATHVAVFGPLLGSLVALLR